MMPNVHRRCGLGPHDLKLYATVLVEMATMDMSTGIDGRSTCGDTYVDPQPQRFNPTPFGGVQCAWPSKWRIPHCGQK